MFKNLLLNLILVGMSSNLLADNIYVSFRWVSPEFGLTESWQIMNTPYRVKSQEGMEQLIKELAEIKKVDTVVVTYINKLYEDTPLIGNTTGDIYL